MQHFILRKVSKHIGNISFKKIRKTKIKMCMSVSVLRPSPQKRDQTKRLKTTAWASKWKNSSATWRPSCFITVKPKVSLKCLFWTATSFSLFRMFLSLFMIATSDHVERHAAHFKTGENHNNLFTITTHPKHAARYFSVCDEQLS